MTHVSLWHGCLRHFGKNGPLAIRVGFWACCHNRVSFRSESTTKKVFRTCIPSSEEGSTGWLPLGSLYDVEQEGHREAATDAEASATSEKGVDGINTPNQLLFVARKALRCQVFDTRFWNDIYHRTMELRDEFLPRQWVEIVHIFKRIKVRKPGLMDIAVKELLYQLERLPLEDLSKLALSFAYHQCCHGPLFTRIAEVVATRLHRQSMHRAAQEAEGLDDQADKSHPLSKITSYTHLVGAFAKCNHPHKELFEAVASDMMVCLASKEMLVPPRFLVKIFASYARFGYRHNKLFDALCKEIVTAKLSSEELLHLQNMVKALDYENPMILEVLAYRLGNSEVANTSKTALISQ